MDINRAVLLITRYPQLAAYSGIVIISMLLASGMQFFHFYRVDSSDNPSELLSVPDYGMEIRFMPPHKLYNESTFTSTIEIVQSKKHSKALPPNYELRVSLLRQDDIVDIRPETLQFSLPEERQSQTSDITVTYYNDSSLRLVAYAINTSSSSLDDAIELGDETIKLKILPSWADRLRYSSFCFIPFFILFLAIRADRKRRHEKLQRIKEKVEQAQIKALAEPQRSKYAWDAARINLEAYFERNRLQVAQVFVIAIIVMTVGFVLVCIGVILAMRNPKEITPPLVAGISGIITQFIGATFMIIYRSTMTQANEFMVILERINTVGMSIQILELIPESETALKNESRAKIVELLLSANAATKSKKRKTAA